MSKVKLGDVAIEHKETCGGSKDGYPIVGLEHLTPEEVTLTAWDEDSDNTFTKVFRKGNVLFGRRRAYLRKAAVAPFDGICSGDITVIEAIPDRILPELLPFIIQNDGLFSFAVGKSAGSLSPRVKWEHLKNYEFELPSMDRQRELAELLWAMDTTKKSYQKLIAATDELVKSQFIEMFGRTETVTSNLSAWPSYEIRELYDVKSSKRIYAKELTTSGIPFLKVGDVLERINTGESHPTVFISEQKYCELKESGLVPKAGDILVTSRGTIGKCYILADDDAFYFQDGMISWLKAKCDCRLLPEFTAALFAEEGFLKTLDEVTNKTTVTYISLDKLAGLKVICPPEEKQREYLDFLRQSDKSKFAIRCCSNLNLSRCSGIRLRIRMVIQLKNLQA